MGVLEKASDQSDYAGCCIAFTCWYIWKSRCDFVFEGTPIDPSVVCSKIIFAVWEYWSHLFPVVATSDVLDCNYDVSGLVAPPLGVTKINIDDAFKKAVGGAGIIFRDSQGIVVYGFCGRISVNSAFMAEAWSLRQDVSMAVDSSCGEAIFETDCAELVKWIDGFAVCSWDCAVLLEDIKLLLMNFPSFSVCSVNRSANKAADWLAKYGLWEMCLVDWVTRPHLLCCLCFLWMLGLWHLVESLCVLGFVGLVSCFVCLYLELYLGWFC